MSLITGIGPAEMIAIFRIIGGIILLVSAIKLIKIILPEYLQKLAFILFLFSEPLPNLAKSFITDDFIAWVWHFGDAARRISMQPVHYSLGKGLALLSLYFLFAYFNKLNKKNLWLSLGIIFLSGLIYPPPNFIVAFSLTGTILIYLLLNRFKQIKITQIKAIGAYLLFCLAPLFILKLELTKGYPWNMWNRVELGWNDPLMHIELDYFRMFWLLFMLLIISLPLVIRFNKFTFKYLFLFIWAMSAFLLFPFADTLSVGKFRFTEGVQIFPLAAIAAITLKITGGIIKEKLGIRAKLVISKILLSGFFAYFLFFTTQVYRDALLRFWPYWKNVYFSADDLASFKFLDKQVADDSIVLTDDIGSSYLPAMARVRTIYGFSDFYPRYMDYWQDIEEVWKIFKGEEEKEKTANFLKERSVDYVYYDKTTYGERILYPELLTKILENGEIVIYQVKKT
ncbi:hypothetical protein A2153_02215 [Candidatus Gottesmanbacteria bacterium RBG_16_38_7b]|uniref:Glycosyltransferase RgtA/B/C/D-like domain-containing protein n=1 Tax=Candidatus Gottesmanbacteria bacterium RBG_16_38_7b TaxID=1798372 RepID=A0A1F5YIS4_9BACT|nr:MAG: hypothetical protein A2153_02215 [Candidatus Gottesmanbacteria bacterium RBG_16_38_7b]